MKQITITITERIRRAWRALLGKTDSGSALSVGMKLCSECVYYKVTHEPAETAEDTKKAPTWTDGPLPYYHEITYMDDLVLVVLYEATEDGPKELARSHGHIIHEGVEGIAQAASYAMKGVWYKVRNE